jgi:hypothetical protein
MPFLQLTLSGAFATLQSEKGKFNVLVRLFFQAGVVALGVGLSGCAGLNADSSPEAKQKIVAERAEARWQLLIKGDLDAAYAYLSAASKTATPLQAYKARVRPGLWREATVEKVECKEQEVTCSVLMTITYDAPVPGGRMVKGVQTPVTESWIIESGSAGFVYR